MLKAIQAEVKAFQKLCVILWFISIKKNCLNNLELSGN